MTLDPRAPRTAKDYPHSPHPGVKANGYNEALTNLAPQLEAADALSACLDSWLARFVATDAVSYSDVMGAIHCCRLYRLRCVAHLPEHQ